MHYFCLHNIQVLAVSVYFENITSNYFLSSDFSKPLIQHIQKILKSGGSLKERAEALVRMANDNGGKDNISVIIIEPSADKM